MTNEELHQVLATVLEEVRSRSSHQTKDWAQSLIDALRMKEMKNAELLIQLANEISQIGI